MPVGGELVAGLEREGHLRARRDEDHVGLSVGVDQDVRALRHPGSRRGGRPVDGRQRLPREHEHGRLVAQLHHVAPGLGDLVRVRRAEHEQSGHRPQRRELLDRLVRRAVLADADRVVREDVDDGDLHQRGEPDRAARVVREDEEPRPERAQLRERESVGDRRRRELAHAEVEVASRAIVRTEVAGSVEREPRLRRRREIRRAADEPRDALRDRVQHLTRRVTAREALRVGRKLRNRRLPGFGKLAALHALDLVRELRMRRAVLLEQRLPVRASLRAARTDPVGEVLADAIGDEELGVLGPAVEALRRADTVGAERLAVRFRRVLDRGAVADVAVHDDQRRPLVLGLEGVERALGLLEVVRVRDRLHVPAVRGEARGDVLGEREVRVALRS